MRTRSIKLLTKTTIIYLIFVVLTFFITARFLIIRSDNYLKEQSERFFQHREHRLNEMIKHHLQEEFSELNDELKEIPGLIKFDSASDTLMTTYPVYKDSLIFNQDMGEYHLYKLKSIVVKADSKVYEYTMYMNIDDFKKFQVGLLKSSKQAFIILALVIVLFSFFLSGFLLRPFHRLLSIMGRYKVDIGYENPHVSTSTSEFIKMKNLFEKMTRRIEDDYRKLKEYTEDMAHEVQTPLAIIRSKAEVLIADEELMKRSASTIKVIYDEATHLSTLGSTLNLLTKIENGEYNNVEQIKTAPIISNHIEAVREMFGLKGLEVEMTLDPNHTLNLDPLLFDVMLKNLVRNALQYSTSSGPICIITFNAELTISNFGNPLPFDSSKIFNRFVGSNGSKSSLGLGLALVKRICDLNHLQINYQFDGQKHLLSITPDLV